MSAVAASACQLSTLGSCDCVHLMYVRAATLAARGARAAYLQAPSHVQVALTDCTSCLRPHQCCLTELYPAAGMVRARQLRKWMPCKPMQMH